MKMLNSRRVFTRNDFLIASGILRQRLLGDVLRATGSLLRNYGPPVRHNVAKKKSFGCLMKILGLVCVVQLAHSVYCDVWCIAFYGEIIYGRIIINACSNCWSEMKHRAFIFVKVFTYSFYSNHNTFLQRLNINKICAGLLAQYRRNASFLDYVLWSDEATFTPNGVFNSRNHLTWHFENPYAIRGRLSI